MKIIKLIVVSNVLYLHYYILQSGTSNKLVWTLTVSDIRILVTYCLVVLTKLKDDTSTTIIGNFKDVP